MLNSGKIDSMTFCTNSKTCIVLDVGYGDKTIKEVRRTKFLGVQIDFNLNWRRVEYVICKLKLCMPCNENSYSIYEMENLNLV
jgi:hypothetical protein